VVRVRVRSEFSITFSGTRADNSLDSEIFAEHLKASFASSLLVRPLQAKLQQQCALQRMKVVVGDQVN
jgi:hypothetical protein